MMGYDRRPAENAKRKAEDCFDAPEWIFPLIIGAFAAYIIVSYA